MEDEEIMVVPVAEHPEETSKKRQRKRSVASKQKAANETLESFAERLLISVDEASTLCRIEEQEGNLSESDLRLRRAILMKSDATMKFKMSRFTLATERLQRARDEATRLWKTHAYEEELRGQTLATPDKEFQFLKGVVERMYKLLGHPPKLDSVSSTWRRAQIYNTIPYCIRPSENIEVFQLIIHNDGPTHLYGSIIFNDAHTLYRRGRDDCETILPSNCASLVGPLNPSNHCIGYYHLASVTVDLNSKSSGGDDDRIHETIQIGQPHFGGNPKFNQPLSMEFTGRNSFKATLKYALFECSLKAAVEVRLVYYRNSTEPPIPANVYGSVFGSIAMFENSPPSEFEFDESLEASSYTTTLLKKSRAECTRIEPYEGIPLSRSFVAVPLSRSFVPLPFPSLKVHVKLMNCNNGVSVDEDDEIAKGSAEFFPERAHHECTFNSYIVGTYGEIQVRVNFY